MFPTAYEAERGVLDSWLRERTYFIPRMKYVLRAAIADLDQFTEPFAAPAAAADVDPPECCASSDPLAPPEAL